MLKILGGTAKSGGFVFEPSEPVVAVGAKSASNLSRCVAVVDMKVFAVSLMAFGRSAYRTAASLGCNQGVKVFKAHPKEAPEIPSALMSLGRLPGSPAKFFGVGVVYFFQSDVVASPAKISPAHGVLFAGDKLHKRLENFAIPASLVSILRSIFWSSHTSNLLGIGGLSTQGV